MTVRRWLFAMGMSLAMTMGNQISAGLLPLERIYAEPALAGKPPTQMKLSPDGQRVTFLRGKAENSFQLDLWSYDIRTKKSALLVDSASLIQGVETLSDEEKARRERMRMASLSGIVDYQFSEDGKKLLFPLSGSLYLYDIASQRIDMLTDAKEGAVSDPKFSPKGGYVSFVRGQNLYAMALPSKKLIALSSAGGALVSFGVAEFVAQEEMSRFTGYWWAPDDSKVVMQRTDESPVAVAKRFEIYADRTEIVEQRYPAAGQNNASVSLFLVDLNSPAQAKPLNLGAETDIYLARVNWTPDAKTVAVQRQSRDQKTLDLVFFDVKNANAHGLDGKIMLTERSVTFVNLHFNLRFLKSKPEFIWSSERSGFNHLYRYSLQGKLLAPITAGEWQVDALLGVDEAKGKVYFSGNQGDPIQQHTYAARMAGGAPILPLTEAPGSHASSFSEDARYFLDTYSDTLIPPQVRLHRADGQALAVLEANEVNQAHPLHPFVDSLVAPSYGQISLATHALQYRIYKPRDFDAAKRYPAVVYTYGGPHVQVLQRKFGDLLHQYLAQQGFIVFSVDNRGSDRRGATFESAIYQKMGGPDVADQLDGIRWLATQPFVDAQRIGVYGWSYGGYMTLHILAQGGDLIHAGAAGAPVTDWSLYDTHYTERYMSTPELNAVGYKNSSVLNHLDGLSARLLLVHGMADDNVLFTNSTSLMSALQVRGVGFDLMTYPGMKHGPATPANRLHVYRGIVDFLKRELRPEGGPRP